MPGLLDSSGQWLACLAAAEPRASANWWAWALGTCLVLAVWLLGLHGLGRLWRERANSARSLYARLARVHRLTAHERRWLAAAAAHACPEQPERVFVDPALLGALVGTPSDRDGHFTRLRARLFGPPGASAGL